MKKKAKAVFILSIMFLTIFQSINPLNIYAINKNPIVEPNKDYKEIAKKEIEKIYGQRSKAFISLDLKSLVPLFDTSQNYGKWSLDHEIKRIKYLNEWSYRRNIKFTDITSSIDLKRVKHSGNKLHVYLIEVFKLNYMYKTDSDPVNNSFSIGLRHSIDLVNKKNNWVVYNDWYTDCFEDALALYKGDLTIPDTSKLKVHDLSNSPKNIDEMLWGNNRRIRMVQYADKYYLNYNKKYLDFTGIGGDCTNFASQTLSDKEGAALKYNGGWHCAKGQGSKAFVNTDAFKNYLIYSGRGRIIKVGTFENLIKKTDYYPEGAISKLIPGDLIAYDKKNNIDHFAIVTSFDSHGYPLINSHTTDRYHVPWDLGWANSNIKFHLIHTYLH